MLPPPHAEEPSLWPQPLSHSHGKGARHTSLSSRILDNQNLTNNNNNNNLGDKLRNRNRQATSLGSNLSLLKHFAFGEEVQEPELATTSTFTSFAEEGHLVLLIDSLNQESLEGKKLEDEWCHEHVEKACKDKLRPKGAKQEDPNKACSLKTYKQKEQQTKEKELHQMELQQKDRNKTASNNSLGTTGSTSSLGTVSNSDLGTSSLEEQNLGDDSLGCEDHQHNTSLEQETLAPRSPMKLWEILLDTGAEISVAPRCFAEDVQLSTLTQNLELRNADGRAINIYESSFLPMDSAFA